MADQKRKEYSQRTRPSVPGSRQEEGGNLPARGAARKKEKHSSKGVWLFFALFAVLCLLGFSKTLFFRVETITAAQEGEGEMIYSEEELVAGSGLRLGSNLFLTDYSAAERAMEIKFPYVGQAVIKKNYPDCLQISVKSTKAVCYIGYEDTYFYLDEACKVLEEMADPSRCALPELRGVEPMLCEIGKKLEINNAKILKTKVDIIRNIVDNYKVQDISYIDVTDTLAVEMGYLGRFRVDLGDGEQMAEKADLVQNILTKELSADEKGTLDVSDLQECHFIPNRGQ